MSKLPNAGVGNPVRSVVTANYYAYLSCTFYNL